MVKFFETAITQSCRKALAFLSQQPFIQDYYLAGGTALALQIGHRLSTDLDWFSTQRILLAAEREGIVRALGSEGQPHVVSEQDGMLYMRLWGTDVSFIYQQYILLRETVLYQGINLASPADIGLMKLAAINSRGARRDFVDLYCLRNLISLDELLILAPQKYSTRPDFLAIAVRALSYFEDAEQQPMPQMYAPARWEDVKVYCQTAARNLARSLSGLK
jgi:predicted nucleotidyltransferase component of viral defense system